MSIMEIKQVGYSYDNKKKVLKGVNAEMEQGKLYAILGPDRKSTRLNSSHTYQSRMPSSA